MQIERKGDNLIITLPCDQATIASGHVSSTGKNWVIGADKLKAGNVTVQVSAYMPKPVEVSKAA